MSYLKCRFCGSKVNPIGNNHVGTCELCLNTQSIPFTTEEKYIEMFNHARDLITKKDFDKAEEIYDEILKDLPNEAEAYLMKGFCKYHVSYDEEKQTFICGISSDTPFSQDENALLTLQNAHLTVLERYKKTIDQVEKARIKAFDLWTSEEEKKQTRLIKKAYQALEIGDWASASEYAEEEIAIHHDSSEAYLCKLLSTLKVPSLEKLESVETPFDSLISFEFAFKYADDETKTKLSNFSKKATEKHNEKIYNSAIHLEDSTSIGAVKKAIEIFKSIEHYKDSKERIKKCKFQLEILEYRYRIYDAVATINADKGNFFDAAVLYQRAEDGKLTRRFISYLPRPVSASNHTVVLQDGRKAVAVGENKYLQCNIEEWSDIIAAACSYSHTLGLKADGTVIAVGGTGSGKCEVDSWKNIIAVAAGPGHSVGLKSDKTVVAVGFRHDDRCKVSEWDDIVSIKAGDTHTVGLKSDGTVVSVGTNDYGQCNVDTWKDIIAISVGEFHTVGLKRNGSVVATGKNTYGECNVSVWSNIIGIAAGDDHTVGLRNDGTVISVGSNEFGQCNLSSWGEIINVVAGSHHTVGVRADGTLIAAGLNDDGRCNVLDIVANFQLSSETKALFHTVDNETDINKLKAIAEEHEKVSHIILERIIKEDEEAEQRRIEIEHKEAELKRLQKAESAEKIKAAKIGFEERKKAEKALVEERISKGLCPHCGGVFKGIFTKKCENCGRPQKG